ncbi:MAG: peptidoglycan-binding protein [Cyanobacteria bacterium P01_H01_bin.21]
MALGVPASLAQTHDLSSSHQSEISNNEAAELLAQADTVLEPGSAGPAVRDLQAMLALMGYYSGAVDGAYEELTAEAVRQFQTDAGLTVDGIVGPLTWQRLLPTPTNLTEPQEVPTSTGGAESPTPTDDEAVAPPTNAAISENAGNLPILMLEDSNSEVSRLQQRLAELDLYVGPVDGVFGPQTQQAVEEFQRQSGLTVDGIVGPATWLALF